MLGKEENKPRPVKAGVGGEAGEDRRTEFPGMGFTQGAILSLLN